MESGMEPRTVILGLLGVALVLVLYLYVISPAIAYFRYKKFLDDMMAEIEGDGRAEKRKPGRRETEVNGQYSREYITQLLKKRMPMIERAKKGKISKEMHSWLLRVAKEIFKVKGVATRDLSARELFLVLYVVNRLVYTTGTSRQDILWLKNYLQRVIIVHRHSDCHITFKGSGKFRNCFEIRFRGDHKLCSHVPLDVVRRGDLERPGKPSARAVLRRYAPSHVRL